MHEYYNSAINLLLTNIKGLQLEELPILHFHQVSLNSVNSPCMSHLTLKWMDNDRKHMIMTLLYCFSLFHLFSLPHTSYNTHISPKQTRCSVNPTSSSYNYTLQDTLFLSLWYLVLKTLPHLSFTFTIWKTTSQNTSLISHSYYTMHRGTISDIYA